MVVTLTQLPGQLAQPFGLFAGVVPGEPFEPVREDDPGAPLGSGVTQPRPGPARQCAEGDRLAARAAAPPGGQSRSWTMLASIPSASVRTRARTAR
ncbi:hypothetical protein GCM10010504_04020 [Streptomyces griseus]|nr:hypothetical protein GCM10010504_04020 [Streptomyces griseus]